MSGKSGAGVSSGVLESLLNAHSAMRYVSIPELPLELVLMKLMGDKPVDNKV